jgi:hypothetical protein
MERSDFPTADFSRTLPHLHQARAGAWPLPAQCLPPTRTSAPAVHATPAPGAEPGRSGAAWKIYGKRSSRCGYQGDTESSLAENYDFGHSSYRTFSVRCSWEAKRLSPVLKEQKVA